MNSRTILFGLYTLLGLVLVGRRHLQSKLLSLVSMLIIPRSITHVADFTSYKKLTATTQLRLPPDAFRTSAVPCGKYFNSIPISTFSAYQCFPNALAVTNS